jgi:CheY-like chemotaxis protein
MKTIPFKHAAPRRVLVADDNPTIRHILKRTLEEEGYAVVAAGDGREAFRILRSDSDFLAAVLDVEMPHISGPVLTKHMQTERRLMRIPVMMMTSSHDPQTHFDSLSSGAAIFLPKPFTPGQLRLMLKVLELNRRANQKLTAAVTRPLKTGAA